MKECKSCHYWRKLATNSQRAFLAMDACHYSLDTGATRLKRGMSLKDLTDKPCEQYLPRTKRKHLYREISFERAERKKIADENTKKVVEWVLRDYIPDLTERTYPEDAQDKSPKSRCAQCGYELYECDTVYQWDNDEPDICEVCFIGNVHELKPHQMAKAMGLTHTKVYD